MNTQFLLHTAKGVEFDLHPSFRKISKNKTKKVEDRLFIYLKDDKCLTTTSITNSERRTAFEIFTTRSGSSYIFVDIGMPATIKVLGSSDPNIKRFEETYLILTMSEEIFVENYIFGKIKKSKFESGILALDCEYGKIEFSMV